MLNIDIQHATSRHIHSIIDVAITAYNEHYTHLWSDGGKSYIRESFNTEVFRDYFAPSHDKSLYTINLDEKLIGFMTLVFGYDHEGELHPDYLELERIYIVKEATGKGIGKEVISFIEAVAHQRGHQIIWLKAMKKSRAVSFYLKHGWKITAKTFLNHALVIPEESGMYIMHRKIELQY